MDGSTNSNELALRFFKSIWENSGLWSCLGHATLEIVFNLPSSEFERLPENDKCALVSLLKKLSHTDEEELRKRVDSLKARSPEDRLKDLLQLCSQLRLRSSSPNLTAPKESFDT